MKDIQNRQDIELLVNSFYQVVQKDEVIGFFFNDIAKVNWDQHLPKMYDFWSSLLFGTAQYKGNPMAVHFPINEVQAMKKEHFSHWLKLWTETMQRLFQGEMADLAIYKAQNISTLMAFKMEKAREN